MIDARLPYPSGPTITITRRRYLSPTDRKRRLEALMNAAAAGLNECLSTARHQILRGLHFRERDGLAIVEVLTLEPEALVLALQAAGFTCEARGMLVRAVRPIRPPGGKLR